MMMSPISLSACQPPRIHVETSSHEDCAVKALRELKRLSHPWPRRTRGLSRPNQPIQIRAHTLAIVTAGYLVFEIDGESVAVSRGDGVILVPQFCRLTEVRDAADRLDFQVLPFSTSLLRAAANRNPEAEAMARPANFPTHLFKLTGLGEDLLWAGITDPRRQKALVFQILFSSFRAAFYIFLARHLYAPRKALAEFLQGASPSTVAEAAERYPGGAKSFNREFRHIYGTSPEDWLSRRRSAL